MKDDKFTWYNPKNRLEVVLLALGFEEPKQNLNNPWLWFNRYFDGIEVELQHNHWSVSGIDSLTVISGNSPEQLIDAVGHQLKLILGTLADEECGIQ